MVSEGIPGAFLPPGGRSSSCEPVFVFFPRDLPLVRGTEPRPKPGPRTGAAHPKFHANMGRGRGGPWRGKHPKFFRGAENSHSRWVRDGGGRGGRRARCNASNSAGHRPRPANRFFLREVGIWPGRPQILKNFFLPPSAQSSSGPVGRLSGSFFRIGRRWRQNWAQRKPTRGFDGPGSAPLYSG